MGFSQHVSDCEMWILMKKELLHPGIWSKNELTSGCNLNRNNGRISRRSEHKEREARKGNFIPLRRNVHDNCGHSKHQKHETHYIFKP